ncbi:hypothetical protein [Pseudoxanthomonas wuyuanensis]|uniref:DUF4157 domain-containing protein n=1 Tax=Pseudoxanthomonas wuyuanensis TaxID=1073196 RepID=A0A286D7W6_9GAMM|nr:hypothetical protein [Pseudoxanthomonas wuyuanensis]KAF1720185.1 hypothetical protein CSC75_12595 [Pseudoxanthomonas wuyuanensis]SOD54745.1 hypothetical protein SAMN06296416_1055 [Pseudoxanthomonas wuyuanensis]
MHGVLGRILVACVLLIAGHSAWAEPVPSCRLDQPGAQVAASITRLAIQGYARLGHPLPFQQVIANPDHQTSTPQALRIYVIKDGSVDAVGADGCLTGTMALTVGEELDPISVRGGCIAAAGRMEIRCSSQAVQMFGKQGTRPGLANPALLYVLAHELGHLLQRRPGEYAGRVEPIELAQSQPAKLDILRESCEPGLTGAEEEADRLAVQVLAALVPEPPYRERLFSSKGSMLWAVDQLNMAAIQWRSATLEREFISQPTPHKSFVPTVFPTPAETIDTNAKTFVCEVLTGTTGVIHYPGRATTHPVLEVRMQRVAEVLRVLAAQSPGTGAEQEYQPISILQEQLSDILTFMYRETGVYLEAVQDAICSRVNSDDPLDHCSP